MNPDILKTAKLWRFQKLSRGESGSTLHWSDTLCNSHKRATHPELDGCCCWAAVNHILWQPCLYQTQMYSMTIWCTANDERKCLFRADIHKQNRFPWALTVTDWIPAYHGTRSCSCQPSCLRLKVVQGSHGADAPKQKKSLHISIQQTWKKVSFMFAFHLSFCSMVTKIAWWHVSWSPCVPEPTSRNGLLQTQQGVNHSCC